ncbi:DUF5047 domain-containing protein [Streptomyces nigrescens]|uniref:DUF5047 domain-containing protein n=1 Tax=Streptomyces nigrescens TaxID=1920 RepID=UPI0037F82BDA
MQPVSAKWIPALATDHGMSVKVSVLYNGIVIAEDIEFADGSVKVDRGSDVRRSLSLSIADPASWPTSETDTFNVYGQRIYVEAGLTYLDGSSERVPLGTFVTTNISGDIHTGPLSVTAAGLEYLLKREQWESATSTAGYASAAAFCAYHIPATVPGASFVNDSTRGTEALATRTWDSGSDKWAALTEVANSVGAELFCNANGTFVLADIPDPEDLSVIPVWDVTTGDNGVMVSADMELTADDVFNRVVVTGENTSDNTAPVSGEAKITDPTDPLRWGGPFGKVTKPYSSSLVTSEANATATAIALLRKYRSPNRKVSLSTVPNPALDAGDRIRVDYGPTGPDPEIHIVNAFDIPLSVKSGAFNISTVSGRGDT